jgi:hypothetical protein
VNQPKKKFADAWAISQVIAVLAGVILAYRRSEYAVLAMGMLFMLMALEPIAKKEINLRGKIIKKEENAKIYFSIIVVYIVGAGICFVLVII